MILYLHGFASGPSSKKATALAARFARAGATLRIPDLTPGEDGFERSSPSSMLAVAEGILGAEPGPHAIIGSSLGGYLAALAASRDPKVERLVLMAPAFRLFERWEKRLSPADLARWRAEGLEVDHFASGRKRRLGWQFHEDARGLPAFPEVKVPTVAFGGTRDETVPLADVVAWVERQRRARLVALDDTHELLASLDRIFDVAREHLAPFLPR